MVTKKSKNIDKVQTQNDSASKRKMKKNEQVKSDGKIHVKEEQEPVKRFSIKIGDQNKARLQNSAKILTINENNSKIIKNIQNVQKLKKKTSQDRSFTKASTGTILQERICLDIIFFEQSDHHVILDKLQLTKHEKENLDRD